MKLLHLYNDLMNLYGEYGNVSAMMRMLEKSGISARLDRLSVEDQPVLSDYDFIYVGSGTESNQKYVLQHLHTLKEELKQYPAIYLDENMQAFDTRLVMFCLQEMQMVKVLVLNGKHF